MRVMEAIFEAGIGTAEITMTVPGSLRVIEAMLVRFGDRMLIGAGTVLDPETARGDPENDAGEAHQRDSLEHAQDGKRCGPQ